LFLPNVWAEDAPAAWPGVKYAKIVGYRFKDPDLQPNGGFLKKADIDMAELKNRTVKTATLSSDQATNLLKAISGTRKHVPRAMCYNPHHLFLFIDENNKVVAAFEFCLECGGERFTSPLDKTKIPDFRAIAKVCEDCGIGLDDDGGTAEAYAKGQDDLEKRLSQPAKPHSKD